MIGPVPLPFGEGPGEGSLLHRLLNNSPNTLSYCPGILQNLIIGKAHDPQPETCKKVRTLLIFRMSPHVSHSINFNYELCRRTVKIDDVGIERMLPAKFDAINLFSTKNRPENDLRFG